MCLFIHAMGDLLAQMTVVDTPEELQDVITQPQVSGLVLFTEGEEKETTEWFQSMVWEWALSAVKAEGRLGAQTSRHVSGGANAGRGSAARFAAMVAARRVA